MKLFFLLLLIYSFSILLQAQENDSIKTYNLDQITVQASKVLESKVINKVEFREIERADAGSIIELGKLIPSVKVQTNSRGESLFFVRGAGERQVSLFFDGVPLNIPWDNRIDLSLIPAEAIGEMNVTKGVPSVIYGANAISGVINISSKSFSGKRFGKILLQRGENNGQRYSAVYLNGNEKLSYLLSSSFRKSDGYNLPGNYNNPIANPTQLRLNSQNNAFDLFGKLNYTFNDQVNLGLSASHINSAKGIPPETEVENPRYWKYPLWNKTSVVLNGNYKFTNTVNSNLNFAFSAVHFKTQIDQYVDKSFSSIDDIEKGDDLTIYMNAIYSGMIGSSGLIKAAINGFSTVHKEEIQSDNFIEQRYAQNITSMGIEYEHFWNNLTLIGGAGLDYSDFPETADKPHKDPLTDYSFNTGLVYSLNDLQSVHLSFGRKTRFPTLRESFSGALGRFIPNPGLKAETAISGEAGLTNIFSSGKADITFFAVYNNDIIVREPLSGGQFQRINKDAARTIGLEGSANYRLAEGLSFYFHLTFLSASAKNSAGEYSDTLEYKPQFISSLNLLYDFKNGLETLLEINYTGEEYGLREGTEYFQKLPDYILMNFRLSYHYKINESVKLELFCRVNNIFDKLYYTQWSLPEAGRQFKIGLSGEF